MALKSRPVQTSTSVSYEIGEVGFKTAKALAESPLFERIVDLFQTVSLLKDSRDPLNPQIKRAMNNGHLWSFIPKEAIIKTRGPGQANEDGVITRTEIAREGWYDIDLSSRTCAPAARFVKGKALLGGNIPGDIVHEQILLSDRALKDIEAGLPVRVGSYFYQNGRRLRASPLGFDDHASPVLLFKENLEAVQAEAPSAPPIRENPEVSRVEVQRAPLIAVERDRTKRNIPNVAGAINTLYPNGARVINAFLSGLMAAYIPNDLNTHQLRILANRGDFEGAGAIIDKSPNLPQAEVLIVRGEEIRTYFDKRNQAKMALKEAQEGPLKTELERYLAETAQKIRAIGKDRKLIPQIVNGFLLEYMDEVDEALSKRDHKQAIDGLNEAGKIIQEIIYHIKSDVIWFVKGGREYEKVLAHVGNRLIDLTQDYKDQEVIIIGRHIDDLAALFNPLLRGRFAKAVEDHVRTFGPYTPDERRLSFQPLASSMDYNTEVAQTPGIQAVVRRIEGLTIAVPVTHMIEDQRDKQT